MTYNVRIPISGYVDIEVESDVPLTEGDAVELAQDKFFDMTPEERHDVTYWEYVGKCQGNVCKAICRGITVDKC